MACLLSSPEGFVDLMLCTWVFSSKLSSQLADWLEFYAKSMEIDIWTSATVKSVRQEPSGRWTVIVQRGELNLALHVDHVVFAIGVGGGTPKLPKIPGMVCFHLASLLTTVPVLNS